MSKQMYLYEVRPNKTLFIETVGNVRTPKSYMLTKQDVINSLPKARIFRRFPNQSVRVTTDSVDRLHNEVLYTEEEWAKIVRAEEVKANATGAQQVVDTTPAQPVIISEEELDKQMRDAAEKVYEDLKDDLNQFTELVKNAEENKHNTNETVAEETVEEEVNTDNNEDTLAEEQPNNTDDVMNIGEESKNESVETIAVDETSDENSTDVKDINATEDIKNYQNNTNHHKNRNGKKHNNR